MFAIDQPYTFALVASIIISLSMAVAVLIQKRALGVCTFAVLNVAIGLWALSSLFEVCSQDVDVKTFAYSLKYLFIVAVPLAWFIFGLHYSNRLRYLKSRQIIMLCILPAMTIVAVTTNRYHHWMFTSLELVEIGKDLFIVRAFGPWFWIHASYSYVLLFLGFFFMGKHLIDSPTHYRWQVATLLVGGLAPWIANAIFTFKLIPNPYLDLTPFAFTISGLAFMIGMVRFQLLDVAPIAQEAIIKNIDEAIIVLDNDRRVINLNPKAQGLTVVPASKQIGAKARDLFPWWPQLRMDREDGTRKTLPMVELHTDNQRSLLRPKKLPLKCNGRETGLLITLNDITAAVEAKEALRSSEERFRSLSENAPVIIFALEPNGTITYLNPAYEQILGVPRGEALGKQFINCISDADSKICRHNFEQLIQGRKAVADLNLTFYHASGAKRLFNTSMAANIDPQGAVTGIIGMAKDITEEHDLQCQLFQSQKMEAIGTLAGGVAHDFNNLLMGMQANLSLMHLDSESDRTQRKRIKRIENQIQSGANLTRQLLGYARKGKYVITSVDLNQLIEEALTVVQRTHKAITVQSLLSDDPVLVKADRGQLELVLLNLFVNAMDAMPQGGKLTVSTRHITKKDQLKDNTQEVPFCEIVVADTGIGMDPAIQKRIFEPFFTTKEVGQGTGLGLASVYGVIQNHGGHVEVDSTKDEGTTFTLCLPTTRERVLQKDTCEPPDTLPETPGKILLVEDEPLILKFSREMIQSLDIPVLGASTGEEAVEIYRQHHEDIDLVVLDMIMPGMDGLAVYNALRDINSRIRVIITSGFATDSRIDEILSQGCHGCLKKPYTRDELTREIKSVLGAAWDQSNPVPA